MKNKIMIVGGYGAVGRIISEQLCTLYPNQVIIAGRRLDKAQTLARKLNDKAIPYQKDIPVFLANLKKYDGSMESNL